MEYSIATNWEPDLPEKLEGTSVASLYGQIWGDPLGGGRMLLFLPRIGKDRAASFISDARRRGLGFNYLINATCLDNMEFSRKGYTMVRDHLEWISSTGADMVTLTLPFLLQIIKRDFPHVKVCISSFARVQNLQMARYWEELGADKIILPEILGRDFETLRLIRDGVDCELELIANHCCLFFCPLDLHHRNMVSHGSQGWHECGGFAVDFCKVACQRMKLVKPAELIKSRWIRPEDVATYEEAGIDCLKIVERFRGTESLVSILKAYERRSYSGNLAELLTLPQDGAYMNPNLDLLERPDLIEVEKLEEVLSVLREPFTSKLYIDNEKLGGFLGHFKKIDCLRMDCDRCRYCEQVASEVITIDDDWRKAMITRFDKAGEVMSNGGIAGL